MCFSHESILPKALPNCWRGGESDISPHCFVIIQLLAVVKCREVLVYHLPEAEDGPSTPAVLALVVPEKREKVLLGTTFFLHWGV